MLTTVVVLPVPGPPLMIVSGRASARAVASFCQSGRLPARFALAANRLSSSACACSPIAAGAPTAGARQPPRQPRFVVEVAVEVDAAVAVEDQRARAGRVRGADHAGGEQRRAQCRLVGTFARRGDVGEVRAHVPGRRREARRAGRGAQRIERVVGRAALAGPAQDVVREPVGQRLLRHQHERIAHGAALAEARAKSASSRASVAAEGRSWNTPAGVPSALIQSGRTPRTKR